MAFFILFGCILTSVSAVVEITEFIPNPEGADDAPQPGGEWVELYNNGKELFNITGYVLKDNNDNHILSLDGFIPAHSYFVAYRDGDRDFSLNNDDDTVRLFSPEGELVDGKEYASSTEGMSWSKIHGEWRQASPTPGRENIPATPVACDDALSIISSSLIFSSDVEFTVVVHRFQGTAHPVTVRGTIETIDGRVVKEYAPWTNRTLPTMEEKDYSPSLPEGTYLIRFWMEDDSCGDINETNNQDAVLIAVRSSSFSLGENSTLEIERISLGKDNSSRWGDAVPITIHVYKGDESKQTGELYVEIDGKRVSLLAKVSMPKKYTFYDLTLSIQLDTNCKREFPDGIADVVLEAFGQEVRAPFVVAGANDALCQSLPASDSSPKQKKEEPSGDGESSRQQSEQGEQRSKLTFFLPEIPSVLTPGREYSIPIRITNEDKEHAFTVWAYVYRGSVCYSCSSRQNARDARAQTIRLDAGEEKVIFPPILLDESVLSGAYKLKVQIRKDTQKTAKDFTYNVKVTSSEQQEERQEEQTEKNVKERKALSLSATVPPEEEPQAAVYTVLPESPGIVVYESNSQKAKKTVPYLLIIGFGLLSIVLASQLRGRNA